MLRNPFYAGDVRWDGEQHRGRREPLVSRDLFMEVQEVLKRHPDRPRRHRFLLRGLAACTACGSPVTAEVHGRYSYYRCPRNAARSRRCRARLCPAPLAHRALESIYASFPCPTGSSGRCSTTSVKQARLRSEAERREGIAWGHLQALKKREIELADGVAAGLTDPEVYRLARTSASYALTSVTNATNSPSMLTTNCRGVGRILQNHIRIASNHRNLQCLVVQREGMQQWIPQSEVQNFCESAGGGLAGEHKPCGERLDPVPDLSGPCVIRASVELAEQVNTGASSTIVVANRRCGSAAARAKPGPRR